MTKYITPSSLVIAAVAACVTIHNVDGLSFGPTNVRRTAVRIPFSVPGRPAARPRPPSAVLSSPSDDDDVPVLTAEVVVDGAPEAPSLEIMARSYRNARVVYCGLAFDALVKSRTLPAVVGPLLPAGANIAVGNALAAAVASILVSAAAKNRLGSDTYRRLNLAVVVYSAVSFMGYLAAWPFTGPAGAFCHVYGALVHMNGWTTGIAKEGGKTTLMAEFLRGTADTARGLVRWGEGGAKSAGYAAATGLLGVMVLHEAALLALKPIDPSIIARKYVGLGRLLLASFLSYTMKDASDRGRLEGTTFIQLNGAMAAAAISAAAVMVAPAVTGNAACVAPRVLQMAGIFGAAGIFYAVAGIGSLLKNREKKLA
mmetsp:Transcript_41422/g.81171  ORF Transcript_41422/g.81171 Transcript_41422/m.81171 type:complete len:370 (-) Transcript_41422:410-1519(-)